MKSPRLRVIGFTGFVIVTNVFLVWNMSVRDVFGQSVQTWKNCGKADGTNNATCPTCSGTCKLDKNGQQSYKICQDAGNTCKMPRQTNASCNGDLYDGGAGGKGGCTGTVQGSCQYSILKCPP
jgi:hypothetical protein